MIEINTARFRRPPPFKHQLEGVKALVKKPAFFLGDSPRTCKSRQVVDAACILQDNKLIDLVLIICPVPARAVWGDKNLGQIKLYSWKRSRVHEFHTKQRDLWTDENPELLWVISNYDFIRYKDHLNELCDKLREYKSILLVLDESSAVGNYTSAQSKAVTRIRSLCSRCVMLNGTPGEPPKLWSQFNILDNVLNKRYMTFTTFRWTYAEWGAAQQVFQKGKQGKQTVHQQVGWKNIDKLSRILAPYCLRRERKDCPELRDIPIMYGLREVQLTKETWKRYQELKREAMLELDNGEVYPSVNAGVRLMRLAQITSGHLGGFETGEAVRDLSREKLDWISGHLINECQAENFIVWCRWQRERERLVEMLSAKGFEVYQLHGGQSRAERRIAEMIFAEGAVRKNKRRYAMIAQPQAGGIALDMSAASEVFRLSNDYSLKTLEQSDDRPLGPAQKAECVMYTDVLATGPIGQRTIDHVTVTALREKKNLARMTTSEWRKKLEDE